MRLQLLQLEIVALHRDLRALAYRLQQRVEQPALREGHAGAELGGVVGQGHQPRARPLVQALHQRQHLVRQHARHQPFAALFADLIQRIDRHRHGEAVPGVARLVQIARRAVDAAQPHGLREGRGGDAGGLVAHQLLARQLQQLGVLLDLLAIPALQRRARAHVGRQLLVVEGEDELVVDQHVLSARLVLQFGHLRQQLSVVRQEGQPGLPLVADQRLADEDLARRHRVDATEIHALVVVDDDAIQRGTLQRHHLRRLLLPVRLEQLRLQQVAGQRRDPLRLDGRQAAAEQARGLHQFSRHQPAPGLLAQVRARVAPELDAACAQVPVLVIAGSTAPIPPRGCAALGRPGVGAAADIAQQPGQHGLVQLFVGGRLGIQPPALFGDHGVQLRVDIAPLAHAARAHETVAQALFLLAVGELVTVHALAGLRRVAVLAAAFLDPVPQLEQAREFRLLVVELLVLLVGGLRRFHGAVAHVLAAQRGGDDQHLGQGLPLARGQDHAADARVQRQLGELGADRCQLVGLVDGTQLAQQRIAVGDGLLRRRFQEREVLDRPQVQRLHAQDHRRQRGAQDLGVGEAWPAGKVVLAIKSDAGAVGHAPAAPGALVRRRLADGLHLQLLDLAAVAVALHARLAAVDDIADPRHRERGLGHVGRQHDAPTVAGLEDTVLLGLRQAREQRQDLRRRPTALRAGQMLAQVVRRFADFAFAGQEDEDVAAFAGAPELVHRVGDGVVEVEVLALFIRPPALLHRKQPARDLDHRRRAESRCEVVRKPVGVDGGRGDDDLQVGPPRQDLAQVAEQEVDIQAALVRLVDDQRVVGAQQRVVLRLGQQDAVGHELDRCAGLQPVLEAHLVADHVAQRRLQLVGDALGHAAGGDAPRLRVSDEAVPAGAAAAPELEHDLRQLRGLARTGLAADDDHRVFTDGARDIVAPGRDRQRFGVGDRRDGAGRGHVGRAPGGIHGTRIISARRAAISRRRSSR